MLLMLHLILWALKCCALLTFVRLASTAFNFEFGVSRQYMRFLELLFRLGEKRIEKVESEHKLQLINGINQLAKQDDDDHNQQHEQQHQQQQQQQYTNSSNFELAQASDWWTRDELQTKNLNRQPATTTTTSSNNNNNNKVNDASADKEHLNFFQVHTNYRRVAQEQKKTRRISMPNGPPVFLLEEEDDSDIDNDYEYCKRRQFQLSDACKFVMRGVSAIVDDQVTKRFTPEELKTWNLLTRTNGKNYQFMSRSLGLYWFLGFLVRYTILMPLRIMFTLAGFAWLICTMSLIGLMPRNLRDKPYRLTSLMSFRMLSCGITSKLNFHNPQYRAKNGDICVANHTSPLDAVLLACDNCYAYVGQRHGGILGILEYALSRATNHVWFDRAELRDRQLVTQRLKEHMNSRFNLPVLIFPEGTCINNSAVMMFKKGSFETTDRVCPVALKYDARFGDPFWNSSKQSYLRYILLMMSSWAIKCDVWYLPPMDRLPGESSADFAGRVKAEIAKQGGLVDLAWDGQLKRMAAKEVWMHQQQEDFAKRLKLE